MKGGPQRAGWEELILWDGWRRDGHCGERGGRAGLWGGNAGVVLGKQKGKKLSPGMDGGGLFLD